MDELVWIWRCGLGNVNWEVCIIRYGMGTIDIDALDGIERLRDIY